MPDGRKPSDHMSTKVYKKNKDVLTRRGENAAEPADARAQTGTGGVRSAADGQHTAGAARRALHSAACFFRGNAVFCIALIAAAVTACLVPPDRAYLSYFDLPTLACLFATLAVVNALRNQRFFTVLAEKIVAATGNLRNCVLALVWITFIGSMLIANDMALLTFLPLGCYVLGATGNRRAMAPAFVLQNAAANLGGMLTPFGNPQNLYLYSRFSIPTGAFVLTMLIPFAVSVALITLGCLFFFPKTAICVERPDRKPLPPVRTAVYLVLFAAVILSVFRLIPYWAVAAVVLLVLLVLDRTALAHVDYPLLLTFVCFFIFSGNLVRIPAVSGFVGALLAGNPLLVAVLSCQVISNVPSAILLSGFTAEWQPLLLGVNIGGVGTLISSLASLITFRTYVREDRGGARRFLTWFCLINFSFLLILTLLCLGLIRAPFFRNFS